MFRKAESTGKQIWFTTDAICKLERLAYLNLAHCHKLQNFLLPSTLGDLFGRACFKSALGSRDHRSGFYIFDCPKMKVSVDQSIEHFILWLEKLLEQPQSFRCGFDIILPLYWENSLSCRIPELFYDQFDGSSKIKVVQSNVDNRWLGFAFCVEFEVNNHPANSGSLHDSFFSPLPHPFYLSFENEYTEEHFDMPLSLELDKIDSSKYLWLIYISREHCHFVETGAHIRFKACPGLLVKKWGFRMLIKKAMKDRRHMHDYFEESCACHPIFDFVEESSCSSSGPKIQLPYNWFVTEKEEAEISQAKSKENDLSILGL